MTGVQAGEKADARQRSLAGSPGVFAIIKAQEGTWLALLIFLFAFALRYLYNAVFMEHRIAHFGDAYNFLRSGSALLQAAATSGGIAEFFAKIYQPAETHVQLLQSMTSMNLTDRLLIDGPVFPAYLAAIEWITGVDPSNPIFDAHSVQLCLCNSFVDSLACVLVYFAGRFAFNKKTAAIAGLLFASYPAAIINTQHCYSEPFSYFLLSAWTAIVLSVVLRHSSRLRLSPTLSWMGIGLVSGLLMLSKPAFVMLPPMVATVCVAIALVRLYVLKKGESRLSGFKALFSSYCKNGILAAVGAVLILTPWVLFNKAASGQYSVFVNRVPSFNIFHGNQIKTDAWRCYPFIGTFPGDSAHVIASLANDAKQDPATFVGLQFKKIARLWSGEWNEYHYSLFGIPLDAQNIYHQILLLLGTLGLSCYLFLSRHKTLSRSFTASAILGTIVLFHFAYIPFEAISRYAITAMPACILLASALLSATFAKRKSSILIGLLVVSALVFYAISLTGQTATSIAGMLPTNALSLAPVIATGISLLALLLCGAMSLRLLSTLLEGEKARAKATCLLALALALAGVVTSIYTIQSQDWKEWSCKIVPGVKISQSILLPSDFAPKSKTAFVLLDISSDILSAPLSVEVNDHLLKEPLVPLAQLQPDNTDIVQCLAIQAEGMSRDVRGFRNWWVIPFDASLLKSGASNTISLSSHDESAGLKIFGDYRTSSGGEKEDGSFYLPSLRSFSYTKGFTTFDHRDPRVFEKLDVKGKTQVATADLSDSAGVQSGAYRMRFLLPTAASDLKDSVVSPAVSALLNKPLILQENPKQVSGQDPSTFIPAVSVVQLPQLPYGLRFEYSCDIKKLAGERPCFVSLSFTGQDENGVTHSWTSRWQPIGIAKTSSFKTTSFSDTVPDEMAHLQRLEIHPMFSPFQPDYLFLHKKAALNSGIEVKNACLRFLPSLDLPPLEKREFELF